MYCDKKAEQFKDSDNLKSTECEEESRVAKPMHDTEERNPKKSRAGSSIVITAKEAYTAQAITRQTGTIQADMTLINRERAKS
jgi:hypothetical protein